MHDAAGLLQDLAVVLCVAALTTVLFRRLKLPVLLGYLLAGLIIGPHVQVLLFASLERVRTLSELGVIVLMFSIGLEFSVGRLLRLGLSSGVIATVEVGLMVWLGYLAGQQLGWSARASFFAGGMVAISSTMIAARSLSDLGADRNTSDLVLGVLIVEDLYAVLMLALLTTVGAGAGLSAGAFALTAARLGGFLLLLVALGLLIVPRALSYVAALGSRETTLVASIGTCFAFALVAGSFGYSVALGAFIAGLLAAESGEARRIELLVRPLRDVFGAIFFVSVGMLIDPRVLLEHWRAIALFTAVVVGGKVVGVGLGALLVGHRTEVAVRTGASLAQIGEFSFLIASLALALGPEGAALPPVAVAVSVLTVFLSPLLTRHADRAGLLVDRLLPSRLRTYLTLWANWLEGVRGRQSRQTLWSLAWRRSVWLLADTGLLIAIVIGVAVSLPRLSVLFQGLLGLSPQAAVLVITLIELVALLPFALGILRSVRRMGAQLADEVLPRARAGLDLAAAPRRALIAGVQMALLLLVALPVLALTQPFLPSLPGAGVLVVGLGLSFWGLWRSATNLEGHVRAGAAMVLEVLGSQSRQRAPTLEKVQALLPGLGTLTPLRLSADDAAVGRTIAELDLHGRSGATILCVSRGGDGVIAPQDDLRLEKGDVLTIAGSDTAIGAARDLLVERPLEEISTET